MKMNKKGNAKWMNPQTLIFGVIMIVLIFGLVAGLYPELQSSGNTLCSTGIKFASFFKGDGTLMMVFAAAVLLGAVGILIGKSIHKGR
jgi:hypothetical protein